MVFGGNTSNDKVGFPCAKMSLIFISVLPDSFLPKVSSAYPIFPRKRILLRRILRLRQAVFTAWFSPPQYDFYPPFFYFLTKSSRNLLAAYIFLHFTTITVRRAGKVGEKQASSLPVRLFSPTP